MSAPDAILHPVRMRILLAASGREVTAPDEHLAACTSCVGALLDSDGRYVRRPGADPAVDGVGFRQARLFLDDEQFESLVEELKATVAPYLEMEPAPSRRARLLSTIVMPDPADAG